MRLSAKINEKSAQRMGARTFLSAATQDRAEVRKITGSLTRSRRAADRNVRAPVRCAEIHPCTTLTNAVGNMTGVVPGSSCMWMTYFMPPGNPSALNIGDTLKVTMTFSNLGVSVNGNSTTGLRIGLFNYSAGGTRISADGFSTS